MADVTPTDISQIELLMPFLPAPLAEIYLQSWIENGDATLATATMRRAPSYDEYFPGNRRPDGSLRYSEQQYLAVTEAFDNTLLSVGINPAHFKDRYRDLIVGNVSPSEFTSRVETMTERVLTRGEAVRQEYADYYGVDMTDEALIAAALDPNLDNAIQNHKIDVAQIGAQGLLKGYGIDLQLAERISNQGLNASQAGDVFAAAAEQLPILDVLARRHNDPTDSFDLNEFLSAAVFNDPNERRRIRRLLAAEQSTFSRSSQILARRNGALSGLTTET